VSLQIGTMLVEAFASWRELEVDFDRRGLVLITGPTGSGKSSIFQALYWSQFGETYKAVNLDHLVNHRLKKNCCVKTYVNTLSVERYRKHITHKDAVRLFRGASDISCAHARETQARLESLAGLTKEAFLGLSYVDGRASSQFLDATRGERAKALDQMFGLDALAKCAAYARQQAGQQAAQVQALMREVDYRHRQFEDEARAARERTQASEAERTRLQKTIADAEAALAEVRTASVAAQEELQGVERGLARLDAEIRQRQAEVTRHQQTRLQLLQLVGEECPYCLRTFAPQDLPPLGRKLAADLAGLEAWVAAQQGPLADRRQAAALL
jgi:DNA repair exonuclease SbcCD ATPase subunit